MSDTNSYIKRLKDEFAESHMEKVFYFCLKKTGNQYEAEDLTSDISLNVLTSLNRGTLPESFSAWVWQIARNRYSVWADKKHKGSESLTGHDIGDYEIEDESERLLDKIISSEELSLLRRELAFISSDYRNIVVAYYIDDRKVKDIASSLNLPEGTVTSKLYRARKKLKEGMSMAREFGKRSYKPEDIMFTQNCDTKTGSGGMKYVERLISKNILLEAYDNPCTAEELSMELGVAMPYLEEKLKILTDAELLTFSEGKYVTNIVIQSEECQKKLRELGSTFANKLTPVVKTAIDEIGKSPLLPKNQSFEDMKLTLTEIYLSEMCSSPIPGSQFMKTYRNGERWAVMGFEKSDANPRYLGVWGNNDFHQIISIGNRNEDTLLCINKDSVPSFSSDLLDTIIKTSADIEVKTIFGRFSALRDSIVLKDIPKHLRGNAMYSSGIDLRLLVIERMIDDGYIKLPIDMTKSSVGVWNYIG